VRLDGVDRTPELFLPIPVSPHVEIERVVLDDALLGCRGGLPDAPFGAAGLWDPKRMSQMAVFGWTVGV
jgi:hypothetical protein